MEYFANRVQMLPLAYKRDAGNPILNTLSKANSAFFQHAGDQQVSAYNHSFVSVI